MLAYQSASAVVFACPAVKVSAWALANGAPAKANARISLFNILDLLCVHSRRRNDPRTRAGSIRSAVRQGKVQAKAHVRSGAECHERRMANFDYLDRGRRNIKAHLQS